MIGLYYRLSGADGDLGKDGKDESNSIENQRSLIEEFLRKRSEFQGIPTEEFIDDGYTGTNFHRPAFERMLEQVRAGSIDTILVKDLSRFGRDYIGVGEYLEQIFPMFRIRFIAINDRYDSDNYKGTTMGLDMVVGNLVNSMYSRDAGRKLYSANMVKWKKGYSTTGRVPFGYLPDGHARYKIDPEAARTVRRIFELALEGRNTRQIADKMNEEEFLIPSVYNRERKIQHKENMNGRLNPDTIWESHMILRILRNEVYTGAMIMGQRKKISGKQKVAPKQEWFITRGVNEPIVTEEEYQDAQSVIRTVRPKSGYCIHDYALRGKLRCEHCKCIMDYQELAYESKVWCGVGRESAYSNCADTVYDMKKVEGIVFYELNRYLQLVSKVGEWLDEKEREVRKAEQLLEKRYNLDAEKLEMLTAEKMRAYENYSSGSITLEEFQRKKKQLDLKRTEIQERIEADKETVPQRIVVGDEVKEVIEQTTVVLADGLFKGKRKLTKEMVQAFIENVFIHTDGSFEIVYKCSDTLMQLVVKMQEEQRK